MVIMAVIYPLPPLDSLALVAAALLPRASRGVEAGAFFFSSLSNSRSLHSGERPALGFLSLHNSDLKIYNSKPFDTNLPSRGTSGSVFLMVVMPPDRPVGIPRTLRSILL